MRVRHLSIFLLALLAFCGAARGQWLMRPEYSWTLRQQPGSADPDRQTHDRPATVARQRVRIAVAPQPEIPNWPFSNVNATNYPFGDQTEPCIAIDPADPRTIVIGANDDRDVGTLWAYVSHDGGMTWADSALPKYLHSDVYRPELATDPSVVFDRNGDCFFFEGRSADGGIPFPPNDIALYRSQDKAVSWQLLQHVFADTLDFNGADTLSDKYYGTIDQDPSSPYAGRMYLVWVDQGQNDTLTRIAEAYSSDQGASWSRRVYLTGRSYYGSPVPATAPDGSLIVSFVDYTFGKHLIVTATSHDGGVSFSPPVVVASYKDIGPIVPPGLNFGYPTVKHSPTVMVNSFPTIAIDPSPRAPGRAYVAWCGKSDDERTHVWLATSDDRGAHWSTARAIEGDSSAIGTDKFFPWIAVDPVSGDVGVDFYDSRTDPTNTLVDLYMAHSTDAGQSFTVRRISSASSDPRVSKDWRIVDTLRFFGDYIGLAAHDSIWRPAWTDARGGDDLEIYTSTVEPYAPMPVSDLSAHDTVVNGHSAVVLRWSYSPQSTFGYPLAHYGYEISREGTFLANVGDGAFVDTTVTAGQGYRYEVSVRSGRFSSVAVPVVYGNRSVQEPSTAEVTAFWRRLPRAGRAGTLHIVSKDAAEIQARFYDELGRLVATEMLKGASMNESGEAELSFMAEGTGVYFYTILLTGPGGSRTATGKVIVSP